MERRLAAILAADVAGYSRLMGEDEAGTLERLKSLRRELVQPGITERKGRYSFASGYPSGRSAAALYGDFRLFRDAGRNLEGESETEAFRALP